MLIASLLFGLGCQTLLPIMAQRRAPNWRLVFSKSIQASHIGEYQILPHFVGWQQRVFVAPSMQDVKFRKRYDGQVVIARYFVFGIPDLSLGQHLPKPVAGAEDTIDPNTMAIMNGNGQTFKVLDHRHVTFLSRRAVIFREAFTYGSGDTRYTYCKEIDFVTNRGYYAFQLDTAGKTRNGLQQLLDRQWPTFLGAVAGYTDSSR